MNAKLSWEGDDVGVLDKTRVFVVRIRDRPQAENKRKVTDMDTNNKVSKYGSKGHNKSS